MRFLSGVVFLQLNLIYLFEARNYHLEGSTGSFSTKETYNGQYPNNANDIYFITVTPGSKIKLAFSDSFWIEKCCDYLTVTELAINHVNHNPNTKLNTGSTETKPADFISQGNQIKVSFYSDQSATGTGFEATWEEISDKKIECETGGVQTGESGSFESMKVSESNGTYARNAECAWSIQVDWWAKVLILIDNDNFSIAEGDYLEIEGSQDLSVPVDQRDTAVSSTRAYSTTPIPVVTEFGWATPPDATTHSTTEEDGSGFTTPGGITPADETRSETTKAETTTLMPTPEGWFTPGGVTPADKEVSETTMPNMNVTYHGTTRRYRRETRNNYADQTTEFYRINGKSAPGKIMSNFNKVDVKFTSDSDEKVSTGFKLNWFKISPVEINQCGSKSVQTGQSGVLESSNYPRNYDVNQNCEWFIEVANNSKILIEFSNMKFADVYPWEKDLCKYDYLEVFDVVLNETLRFCDQQISFFASEGRFLKVKFVSDKTQVSSGFSINWSELKTDDKSINDCGSVEKQTGKSGEFSSFGFPDISLMRGTCKWSVRVEDGYRIRYEVELLEDNIMSVEDGNGQNQFIHSTSTNNSLLTQKSVLDFEFESDFEQNSRFKVKWLAEREPVLNYDESCEDQVVQAENATVSGEVGHTNGSCYIRIVVPRGRRIIFTSREVEIRADCLRISTSNKHGGIAKEWCVSEGIHVNQFLSGQQFSVESDFVRIETMKNFVGKFEFDYYSVDRYAE